MCQYVECHLHILILLLLLLMPLVECWCMHMPHRSGRPSGVDHTNGGERRTNSNSIVSHATLILKHHASMLTIHITCTLVATGVILRSLDCIMNGQSGASLYSMPHMINRFNNDLLNDTITLTC